MIASSKKDSSSLIEMSDLRHSGNSLDRSGRPVASDGSMKRSVWGVVYYLARISGLVLYVDSENTSTTKKILHVIPNLIITVILLINTVYCATKMSTQVFSINWCYSISLFFISLHGTVSSTIIIGYKYNNYFEKVIFYLRGATRNNVSDK